MGKVLTGRRWNVVLPAAAGVAVFGMVGDWGDRAHAQGRNAGVHLTFGVQQRFETDDNSDLTPNNSQRTSQAATQLSFGLSSDTGISRLALTTAGKYRVARGPDFSGTEAKFTEPSVGLSYTRRGADADFSLSGSVSERDVAFLRPLEDFIDPLTGTLVLPDDLENLNGNGKRRNSRADAKLNWGTDAPVGFGVSAGYSDLNYRNVSSNSLVDSRRAYVGTSLRLALTPASTATVGLRYSTFDDDDPTTSRRNTYNADLDLVRSVRGGSWSAGASVRDTADGTNAGVRVGRSLNLPRGALSTSVGVGRGVNGNTELTGALGLSYNLPLGQISANLNRSVTSGANDTERLLTALSTGYTQRLSDLSSFSLSALFSQSEDTRSNITTQNASFGVSYNHTLTPDWGLNLGYRHRIRDVDGQQSAASDSVFLVIRRDFDIKY